MKVLMCSPEVVPFVKTGGLADVLGALPLQLASQGVEVAVVLPKYKAIEKQKSLRKISDLFYCTFIGKNIRAYFIANDAYFNRSGLYGDESGDYKDNLARFAFYCRQALDLIKKVDFKPDVIHCHEWQSGLIPVYLKTKLKQDIFYKQIKTLFTIHNLAYQGIFSKDEFSKLFLDKKLFSVEGLEFYGKLNLLKGAIVFSDYLNTVSPTYAKEILTPEFGCGLDGVLLEKKGRLSGILNGLDYNLWDPRHDKYLFKAYSSKKISDKYINKERLCKELGFTHADRPLFGVVSRLADQKGFDLIAESVEELLALGIQLVVLGIGEEKYHRLLKKMQHKYPKFISAYIKFDDILAHRIYAAADVFLMPSRYEPCGLGQMISLRYGTIPLVFKTGGLADTVDKDNGFVFSQYNKDSFLSAVRSAMALYENKRKWLVLVKHAFSYNFSWEESARKYIELYKKCIS